MNRFISSAFLGLSCYTTAISPRVRKTWKKILISRQIFFQIINQEFYPIQSTKFINLHLLIAAFTQLFIVSLPIFPPISRGKQIISNEKLLQFITKY
jgi:hypothetical protein